MSRDLSNQVIPRHLAIIMDGNGRWAQQRGLPRIAGHQEGMQTVKRIVEDCTEIVGKTLTLYSFSTENWRRQKMEVDYLMRLAEEYAKWELPDLQRNGVRLQRPGRREKLPGSLLGVLDKLALQRKETSSLILNPAINYDGRAEIVNAMVAIIMDQRKGLMEVSEIDENNYSHHLYYQNIPDADLAYGR